MPDAYVNKICPRLLKLRREVARCLVQIFARSSFFSVSSFWGKRLARFWNRSNMLVEARKNHYLRCPYPIDPRLTPLDLSCTSGYGQTVHPCARYIQQGFGAESWRFVMVITGFPHSHDFFENPELLVSHDGANWKIPGGGHSPVVPPPMDWLGYHSDPFLFYENGLLSLIYRRVLNEKNTVVLLNLIQSEDGVTWTAPQVLLRKDGENALLSPSVIKNGEGYAMWYVNGTADGDYMVCHAESLDLKQWDAGKPVKIEGLGDQEEPWHLEVVKLESNRNHLAMLLTTFFRQKPQVKQLVLAESDDHGFTWRTTKARLFPEDLAGESESLYKSSILVRDDGGPYLYLSLKMQDGCWWTCMGNFTRETILGDI